jgi:hypothetical protein
MSSFTIKIARRLIRFINKILGIGFYDIIYFPITKNVGVRIFKHGAYVTSDQIHLNIYKYISNHGTLPKKSNKEMIRMIKYAH